MINNNFSIFIGIFILFLMLGIIILLYYIYKTYTIYKNNMDFNLSLSEKNVNDTSIAFDNFQKDINDKINNSNNKNNVLITNEPVKFNVLNSNLNKLFNINNFNDYMNSNLTDNINIKNNSKITNYSTVTNLTGNNNYFKICDNTIDENNRTCINLNVDNSGNFNIFPGLNNVPSYSNAASLSIYNKNKNILAKFDLNNNIISLGSDTNPAISINNNIYTPNIIICNYTFQMETLDKKANIKLNYISNYGLNKGTYLNFIINSNYNFHLARNQLIDYYININSISYVNNILKLLINTYIPANTIIILTLDINANDPINYPITNSFTPLTTNGYLTLS